MPGPYSLFYPKWKAAAFTVAFLTHAAGTTTGSTLYALFSEVLLRVFSIAEGSDAGSGLPGYIG